MNKTVRGGVDFSREMLMNTGPGQYEPKHPADIQKKVGAARNVKS